MGSTHHARRIEALELLVLCTTIALLIGACSKPATPEFAEDTTPFVDDLEPDFHGLVMRLESAQPLVDDALGSRVVEGDPLSDGAADVLLARLITRPSTPSASPSLASDRTQVSPWAFDDDSLKVADTLAAPDFRTRRRASYMPLTITKYGPVATVEPNTKVRVVFSLPLAQAGRADPPITIEPEVAGKWHWVDVRTVEFKPEGGYFPPSTRFDVSVSTELAALSGLTFEEDHRWSFSTFEARIIEYHPRGRTRPEPLLVLAFNTLVEADDLMLSRLTITSDTGAPLTARRASPERLREDPSARQFIRNLAPGTWIAIEPDGRLAGNSAASVYFHPDLFNPTATTARPSSFFFRTAPAFEFLDAQCGDREDASCQAIGFPSDWTSYAYQLRFSTPIDPEHFDPTSVVIEPPIAGSSVQIVDGLLHVIDISLAQGRHTITVPATLQDIYGQALGKALTHDFELYAHPLELLAPTDAIVTLNPNEPRSLPIWTAGLSSVGVSFEKVAPADLRATVKPLRDNRVTSIKTNAWDGALTRVELDLGEFINENSRHGLLTIDPRTVLDERRYPPEAFQTWLRTAPYVRIAVQFTHIGLDAFTDPASETTYVWATSLVDNKPLAGVELVWREVTVGTTDAHGYARLPGLNRLEGTSSLLTGRLVDDTAVLDLAGLNLGKVRQPKAAPEFAWHIFDDRQSYRPGEHVHLKGWLRRLSGTDRRRATLATDIEAVDIVVADAQATELGRARVALNDLGGFDHSFALPVSAQLGQARVSFQAVESLDSPVHRHSFRIDEFRRPEFEVTARPSSGHYVVNDTARLELSAHYFTGGGLLGAPVTWQVSQQPARFVPPNHADFHFGRLPDNDDSNDDSNDDTTPATIPLPLTLESKTDTQGNHVAALHLDAIYPRHPVLVTASPTVTDVNRQMRPAEFTMLVHPAANHIGLRARRGFLRVGEKIEVDAVVTDVHGSRQAGRAITMRLVGPIGAKDQPAANATRCETRSLAIEPVSCTFEPRQGGTYHLVAEVEDILGRLSQSTTTLEVVATAADAPTQSAPNRLNLLAQRAHYSPGDTAQILVLAGVQSAHGVATVGSGELIETHHFRIEDGHHILEFPLSDRHAPNTRVHVTIAASSPRPIAATSSIELEVSAREHALELTLTPAETSLMPAASTRVELLVRDSAGRAVPNADVALWVVDEAVLALTNYELSHPHEVFFARQPSFALDSAHLRNQVFSPANDDLHALLLARLRGDRTQFKIEGRDRKRVSGPLTYSLPDTAAKALPAKKPDPMAERFSRASRRADDVSNQITFGDDKPAPKESKILKKLFGGRTGERFSKPQDAVYSLVDIDEPRPQATPVFPILKASGAHLPNTRPSPTPTPPVIEEFAAALDPIALRQDFGALVAFSPSLRTDEHGRTHLDVTLPDSITRYRVMAVAAAGETRFGKAESTITARLELMVRPALPRFLTAGDRFELPIVVHNQSDREHQVDVAVRVQNLVLSGPHGRRVSVPAGDRVEVRFSARADQSGPARVDAVAAIGSLSDAASTPLTVYAQRDAPEVVYGQLDDAPTAVLIELPRSSDGEVLAGAIELSASSSVMQDLSDAVLYLIKYRYDCTEQIASRLLAITAARELIDPKLRHEGLDLDEIVARDIATLSLRQQPRGDFGLWRKHGPPSPFSSIHAVHALFMAKENGYEVSTEVLLGGQDYVNLVADYRDLAERHQSSTARAYALYVLDVMGMPKAQPALEMLSTTRYGIFNRVLPVDSLAWLFIVLSNSPEHRTNPATIALRDHLLTRIVRDGQSAHINEPIGHDNHFALRSRGRAPAVVLQALMASEPTSKLIEPLVHGLLASRENGRWDNTQENAFAVLALSRYFRQFEHSTGRIDLQAWAGHTPIAEHGFVGLTTRALPIFTLPLDDEALASSARVVLQKRGRGRLYYRLAMHHAPEDHKIASENNGISVIRHFEPLDALTDVTRDEDGTWRFRAGARVRVNLTIIASAMLDHVALADALPAGLEIVHTAAHNHPWFDHEQLSERGAQVFATALKIGPHNYSYITRATTPGHFFAAPAHAEQMYNRDHNGHSATDVVIVY